MVSTRLFAGNAPKDGELVAARSEWQLYQRSTIAHFVNYKLVSMSPRAKANYHLGWDTVHKKLVRNRDARALKQHVPELHAWVIETICSLLSAK